MVKNPYEALEHFIKEKYERDRNLLEFTYKQSDSFITWVIGFAVAALSLIASKFDSIGLHFKDIKDILVILFGATIILGVAFRYLSYGVIVSLKRLEDYFDGIFSDVVMTPIEAGSEIGNSSFDDILLRLKLDFDQDIQYASTLTEREKAEQTPKLIALYKKLCANSKEHFDIALGSWAEAYEIAYGIKKEKAIEGAKKQMNKGKIGFKLKVWTRVVNTLYLLALLAFLIAVIIVCFKMIG